MKLSTARLRFPAIIAICGASLSTACVVGAPDQADETFASGGASAGGAGGEGVIALGGGDGSGSSWSARFGGAENDRGSSVATDAAGNVFLAGGHEASIDFLGGGPLALGAEGARHDFVVKLDGSGKHLWSKSLFTAPPGMSGFALAAGPAGELLVAGQLDRPVDFRRGTLTPQGAEMFALKLDPAGGHVWSKQFGYGLPVIAAGGAGEVILAGGFDGTLDFGSGAITSEGAIDAFVAKLDPDGDALFVRRFGESATAGCRATGVAVDMEGNVLVVGTFTGTAVDFGGGSLAFQGTPWKDYGLFAVKLSPAGEHVWSKLFGAGHDTIRVAVDASGAAILAGQFTGAIDFGGGSLASSGLEDAFVAKLARSGEHVWSKRFGGFSQDVVTGVAVSPAGDVAISGAFFGTVDFGGGPLSTTGATRGFVAVLGPSGEHVSSRPFDAAIRAVAIDAAGATLLTGSIAGAADLGGGMMASAGKDDVFAVKLAASGAVSP